MENIIKGVHLLKEVSPTDLTRLEDIALQHYRNSFLSFRIMKIEGNNIVIRVTQDKEAGEYFPLKKLIQIVHDTFDQYLPGKKVLVHAQPYKVAPVDQVSEQWINKQMLQSGITLKKITEDTGLNKTYISTLVNGGKPLSQAMKAMFYYYFLASHGDEK